MFVSSTGSDDGAGTPDAPVKTLAQAIQLAVTKEDEAARRVYACAETFEEAVTVTAGVTIHGGLDCKSNWRWDGEKRTVLTASPGVVPLTMRAVGDTVRLEDVHIFAPEIDPTDAGKSAIAAIADRCKVALVRCTVEAGDAAPGASGAGPAAQREPGNDGTPGNDACSAETVSTVAPLPNDCGTPDTSDDSLGGRAGNGFLDRGGGALSGSPGEALYPNAGNYDAASTTCSNGGPGRNGDPGEPGAAGRGIGQLSSMGYAGVRGQDGKNGRTAQGGGGGGGARGNYSCPLSNNGGASGGNGGAGGCGGAGGKGGFPGGSSIALLSLNAKLTFREVLLIAGNGGEGGDGSEGQTGGQGGGGGRGGLRGRDVNGALIDGMRDGCTGGMGGQGGTGGRGGGGQGGHSLGIAFQGTPDTLPSLDGATFRLGDPGPAGTGSSGQNGDAGQASEMLDFSSPQRAPAP
ncbi:hypothetical protein WME76_44155 (plasmid) [Sorangium sp. So ce119]|uniref:hypothetical protein n=1 Tax=Sorangium sp. So ce119 TaxID=3133279 RepID=UPI003F5F659D